jgi:hypothetical protein
MAAVLLDIFDGIAKPYGKSQKAKHAHWNTIYDDLPDLPACRLMQPNQNIKSTKPMTARKEPPKKPHKQAPAGLKFETPTPPS